MKNPQDFTGDLSNSIYNFLESMDASQDYKTNKFYSRMRILDDMCLATEHASGLLDEKIVMALHYKRNNESFQSWRKRSYTLTRLA